MKTEHASSRGNDNDSTNEMGRGTEEGQEMQGEVEDKTEEEQEKSKEEEEEDDEEEVTT